MQGPKPRPDPFQLGVGVIGVGVISLIVVFAMIWFAGAITDLSVRTGW